MLSNTYALFLLLLSFIFKCILYCALTAAHMVMVMIMVKRVHGSDSA